ncbi:LacI family DNA-binding transcriptional regulator [Pseudactinotalea sp.]|uniref:LacI family DNA-binding transcriptional regulator n=1 Tax=Pseudactinotalea sp. TaxID=1926260 RepID=UPI003B3B9537
MADVAAAAGVSRATVSRVLSGDPAVIEPTATAVREVIDRLGYRPDLAARALMGSSRTLGVLFGEPPARASAHLLAGIHDAATSEGYTLTVAIATDHEGTQLRRGLDAMVDQRIAAAIVLPATPLNAQLVADADVPFPVVSTTDLGPDAPLSIAALNEREAVDVVVNHLQQIGRTRILHISDRPGTIVSQMRHDGWAARVGDPALYETSNEWTANAGYEALHRAIARGVRPDAVFAASDDLALGILRAAAELNLRVPEDLAVAGFGGFPITEYYGPGLTTMETDLHERGSLAVDECLRRLAEPTSPPERRLLPAQLVVRSSTVLHPRARHLDRAEPKT